LNVSSGDHARKRDRNNVSNEGVNKKAKN